MNDEEFYKHFSLDKESLDMIIAKIGKDTILHLLEALVVFTNKETRREKSSEVMAATFEEMAKMSLEKVKKCMDKDLKESLDYAVPKFLMIMSMRENMGMKD